MAEYKSYFDESFEFESGHIAVTVSKLETD